MRLKSICFLIFMFVVLDMYGQKLLIRAFQPSVVVNKVPYGNNPETGKYAQTKDAKIYYEVYGKGQPVVLLHGGLFGSTIEFADLIDKLKSNFQVIAISTRGHGKSELGTESMTLEQRATDVMTVTNAVTKEKVIVIGFSDGGYAAYYFAKMYPEKVKKITKETLNFFIVTTMYMGYKNLEKTIYEICCKHLSIDSSFDKDFQFSECKSYLDFLEVSYSHQTVSQVFQNVINQIKKNFEPRVNT